MKRKAQVAKPATKRGKKDVTGSAKTALENYGKTQQEQQEQLYFNSKALRLNEENSVTCVQDYQFDVPEKIRVAGIINNDTIAIVIEHNNVGFISIGLFSMKTLKLTKTGIIETEIDHITQYNEDCILYVSGPNASSIRIYNLKTRTEMCSIMTPFHYMRKVTFINPELIMVESPGSLLFFSVTKKTIKKIHMSSTHCSDNCDMMVLNNGTVCNTDPRCGAVFSDLTTTHKLPHNTFEDSREFPLLIRISKDEVLLVRQRHKRFDLFCIIDTKNKQVTRTFEMKSIFGISNAVEMGIDLCQGVVAFACADNNIRIVDIDQVRVLSSSNNRVDVTIRGMKRVGMETIVTVTDIGFRIYKILANNKQQDSLLNHLIHGKWCDINVCTQ
jgi:hypothetical protein